MAKSKKTKLIWTTIIGIILIIVMALSLNKTTEKETWEINTEALIENIKELEEGDIVTLSDVTPFDWDVLYALSAYMPKESMYNAIGTEWRHLNESYSDGMSNLVFMNAGEVVAYIYGYPGNNGYGIYFSSHYGGVYYPEEDREFDVMKLKDGTSFLSEQGSWPGYDIIGYLKKFENLYQYKSKYIGDNSNTANLVKSLLYGQFVKDISLQTDKEPYGITVNYKYLGGMSEGIEEDFFNNAAVIFSLIDNVEEITFVVDTKTKKDNIQKSYTLFHGREKAEEIIGKQLSSFSKNEEIFNEEFLGGILSDRIFFDYKYNIKR